MQKRWFFAWFAAHLLTFLATLAGGLQAIVLLYFPLLWLRRPLRIGRRLMQGQHWVSLALLAAITTLWLVLAPDLGDEVVTFFSNLEPRAVAQGYAKRLGRFPVRTLLGALPWALLAWPTFCALFRPLERQPIFCGYLRTMVTATFFLLWLVPLGRTVSVLPLLGPLAILIGMNYELLVRRYGPELRRLAPFLAWLVLLAAGFWTVFCVTFHERPAYAALPASVSYGEVAASAAAVLLAGLLIVGRWRQPTWLLLLLAVTACRLLYAGSWVVYRRAVGETARNAAAILARGLPPADQPVFLLSSRNPDAFTAEWFYLGRPLQRRNSLDDLFDRQTIHVIGEGKEPVAREKREWQALTPTVGFHDQNQFRLWKGVLKERAFQWEARTLPATRRVAVWPSSLPAGKYSRELRQERPPNRPLLSDRGFADQPVLRFTGAQVLHRTDATLGREIGDEYTLVMVVAVRSQGARQTLLDLTAVDNGEAVLQRLVYLPASNTLIARCGGTGSAVHELKTTANLSQPSVIVVRRDSKAFHVSIDDKDTSLIIPGQSGLGNRSYVMAVGATWDGRRFTDFLDGDLAELRLYNKAVSDERRQAMVQSLRQTYVKTEKP